MQGRVEWRHCCSAGDDMLHFLYSTLFRLAMPMVLFRLWRKSRGNPKAAERWPERLGYVTPSLRPVLWLHAVSVGETIAAAPLVHALQRRCPELQILVTSVTLTGSERARSLFGDSVTYAYAPYDIPGAVRRFVARTNPLALIIMETELWPNMVREAERKQCPVFLVNARLSERSANGYRKAGSLIRTLLSRLTWIAAQAEADARRLVDIGADPARIAVTGSIKFEVEVTAELRQQADRLRALVAGRRVWLAASTHEGEESQILAAHRQILESDPDALLILVPRHPERFDGVAREVGQMGLTCARRSLGQEPAGKQVYLADTMGELMALYGACDLALVGGSMVERGGHNPLEPAAWGIPVLSGPHIFNFQTIYQQLEDRKAYVPVDSAESLAREVIALFADGSRCRELGVSAHRLVEENRGTLEEIVEGIVTRLP